MKPNSTPKLVPLNNLQSDIVEANLVLPANLGLEQLGINIIRLETLCRVAGISKLTIGNKRENDQGATIIAGRNRDGTAIGGLTNSKAISKSAQKRTGKLKMETQIEADIQIDIASLASKISEKFPEGVRSLEGWSQELEEVITKHLGNEGVRFLLSGSKVEMIFDIFVFFMMLEDIIKFSQSIHRTVMLYVAVRQIAYSMLHKFFEIIWRRDSYLRVSPLSIVGIEWDRALVLMGMIASTRNLVGKITEK